MDGGITLNKVPAYVKYSHGPKRTGERCIAADEQKMKLGRLEVASMITAILTLSDEFHIVFEVR